MKHARKILSISGISTGLAKELYTRLKERLGKEHPELSERFVFLGSPFAQSGLSHPLDLTEQESCLPITTRLLKCWVMIDQFNHDHLIRAFDDGKIPIVLRYGLDAFLYARASCDCTNARVVHSLEAAHEALVHLRVIGENIPAPHYLVPWVPSDSITKNLIGTVKALKGLEIEDLRQFNGKEERLIKKYCSNRDQKPTHWIEGNSIESMCDEAIRVIIKALSMSERTLAHAHR